MRRFVVYILAFFFTSFLYGQPFVEDVNVRVFSHVSSIQSLRFTCSEGSYSFYNGNTLLGQLEQGQSAHIQRVGGVIQVHLPDGHFSVKRNISIERNRWGAQFVVQLTSPSEGSRPFPDNLFIRTNGSKLELINQLYIEHYIAGVVEAEAGSKQVEEYYKVQAVICRTYSLKNLKRHQHEGFNLCDQVHCQAYKGRSRFSPFIKIATYETKGLVLVDSEIELINASYFSNCGGETEYSEKVWTYPLDYLQKVCDTFCSAQPHAHWQKTIAKSDWLNYIVEHPLFPNYADAGYIQRAINYMPEGREEYFQDIDASIPLKTIRKDWGLRSTLFTIAPEGDSLLFQGYGFGHGVGLCQEGAMKMADLGYSFDDILHYYYRNVHLIHLSSVPFFKDEEYAELE